MKIGIVTFYAVANYGAMLQAYALYSYLTARGHNVMFLDSAYTHPHPFSLWYCLMSKSPGNLMAKFRGRAKLDIVSFSRRLPTCRNLSGMDAVIAGSDQIWNPTWCKSSSDIEIAFLGSREIKGRRLSYAASFGVPTWGDEKTRFRVSEMLKTFDAISVREESAIEVVQELTGRSDAVCLMDPTLLVGVDFYKRLSGPPDSGRYIFGYILFEHTTGEAESRMLRQVQERTGIVLVESDLVRHRFFFNTKIPVEEWLSKIRGASYVVTNSFHGTVFAILFHRPFVVCKVKGVKQGMNERLETLLGKLGLRYRLCDAEDTVQLDEIMAKEIDWRGVDERLQNWRRASEAFFSRIGL